MQFPSDRFYTKTHEWVKIYGGEAILGITSYAIEQLGDITFIEVKPVGTRVRKGDRVGVVESSKTTERIYSPVSGEIIELNRDAGVLEEGSSEAPMGLEKIVQDPYGDGWVVKLKVSGEVEEELKDLMSAEEYAKYVEESH